MAPKRLQNHPGKRAALYDFVASGAYNSLVLDTEGTIEVRTISQHELVKYQLQQRLGRRPAPMAPSLWPPYDAAHVIFDKLDAHPWEAKFACEWQYKSRKTKDFKTGELMEVNRYMQRWGFRNVSWAQVLEQLGDDEDELDVIWGPGKVRLYHSDVRDDMGTRLLVFDTDLNDRDCDHYGPAPRYDCDDCIECGTFRRLTAYAKKRRGEGRARLTMEELQRLLSSGEFHVDGYDEGEEFELYMARRDRQH